MTGIYVHLPFCPYICPYCDFAKRPFEQSLAERYLQALHREIDATPARAGTSVFLGGGTPNTLADDRIESLLSHLRARFPGPANRETTIELNPELAEHRSLAGYASCGVTRVSIGVQSFVPAEIRTLGRRHTPEDVRRAVEGARSAPVRSINVDLIFGVPGQTRANWRRSLELALALEPDHISTYGLTVEPETPYAAWFQRTPEAFASDDMQAELYEDAIALLEPAGFEHYEISNFARPGHRCIHNENYWANGDYVGLGVGAASYLGGVRSVHTKDLEAYIAAAAGGLEIPRESERLEGPQKAGEAAMLALRTAKGVSFAGFKERYGLDFLEYYASIVETYRTAGFMEVDSAGARLTRRGRFIANEICASFITLP